MNYYIVLDNNKNILAKYYSDKGNDLIITEAKYKTIPDNLWYSGMPVYKWQTNNTIKENIIEYDINNAKTMRINDIESFITGKIFQNYSMSLILDNIISGIDDKANKDFSDMTKKLDDINIKRLAMIDDINRLVDYKAIINYNIRDEYNDL